MLEVKKYPEDLRYTYEHFTNMRRKNPWLWLECSIKPYTVEWGAYKTLELLADFDVCLRVQIDPIGKAALILISAETGFQHPDALQRIRIEDNKVLEDIVIGNINGRPPLEHYRHYFIRLPEDVQELLKTILE